MHIFISESLFNYYKDESSKKKIEGITWEVFLNDGFREITKIKFVTVKTYDKETRIDGEETFCCVIRENYFSMCTEKVQDNKDFLIVFLIDNSGIKPSNLFQ